MLWSWLITKDKKAMVSTYAIGSLLPLSNSNVGLRFVFSARLFERKIENTAAASVDETMEPKSILS